MSPTDTGDGSAHVNAPFNVIPLQGLTSAAGSGTQGLPDLRMELDQVLARGDVALAHGTVRGTATGRLYGAPATRRSFQASFFDYIRVDDGRIIERIQQADVLAQMQQLYGKTLGLIGLDAMFLRH